MSTSQGDCDVVEASPAGRWLAVAGIVAAIALMAVFHQYIWPLFQAASAETADAVAINRLRNAVIGVAAVGIGCAAYLLFYGRAVLASGRTPPPAARMWRATRAIRGDAARRYGWLYLVCGAVALLAVIGLVAMLHNRLADLPLEDVNGVRSLPAVGAAAQHR